MDDERYEEYIQNLAQSSSNSNSSNHEVKDEDAIDHDDVHLDVDESCMSYDEDGRPVSKILKNMDQGTEDKSFWNHKDF